MKIGSVLFLLFAAECSGGSRHYQKKIHQSIQRLEGSNSNSAHYSNESEGERHQRHYQRYEFAYEITTAVTSTFPSKIDLARSDMPYFAQPIDNLTVAVGREAVFPCVINNLTKYKVAWLREGTHSLLSIHDKVITRNYRISLIEAADKHWTLKISAVQESDTGWYMCQINTDPMLFQKAYLQVVVPPDIIDEESSSTVDIREGENATLICRARGNPTPSIMWRREDGAEIVTNSIHRANSVEGEILFIQKATRLHMGRYLCIASNGVPPMVSKRVSVNVHFPPRVLVPHQLIGIMQGQEAVLTCHAEVYPKAITYWTTDRGEVISVGGRFTTLVTESEYKISMVLRINPVKVGDFRKYRCFIRNSLGDAEGSILLQEISAVNIEMKTKEILPTTEVTARSEQKTGGTTLHPPQQLTHSQTGLSNIVSVYKISSSNSAFSIIPALPLVSLSCYLLTIFL